MSINFINEGLTKKIVSDKLSTDGNDVTNLISLNPAKRSRGFLAENFVKPPVVVNVEFICSISINKVIVDCQVGVQKSSVIELFTRQNGRENKVIVAKKVLKDSERIVNFVPHSKQASDSNCVTFRLSKYMCEVNEISIRILFTHRSTLPAIGKIEVWGKPSKCLNKETVKEVNDLWNKIISNYPRKVDDTPSASTHKKTSVFRYCRERKLPEVHIPEEFLDPITCEVLVIPMTLPSGKVIDVSTLERFTKAEEEFGRPPSDPFTGCVFTESSRPVVAAALKARLDRFLLENSSIPSLKSLPRTIGRAPPARQTFDCYGKRKCEDPSIPSPSKQIRTVDELVESCLQGLPSYLEKPPSNDVKLECFKCESKTLLFKLTCSDLFCRSCLLTIKKENKVHSCLKCHKLIEFRNVERFHAV